MPYSLNDTDLVYDKYEFIYDSPGLAIPCIVVLIVASLVGTVGNVLILIVVAKTKELKQVQSIFIVNLAISDLYVTLVADPMSIVGKVEGRQFFEEYSKLCKFIGKMCTISCVSSLGSISFLSFNRYVFICHNTLYNKIFKRKTAVAMCVSLYIVGLSMILLNSAGIGNHGFDDKSLECIWDRMATYSYTVIFSVCLVWLPLIVVGVSYFCLFLHVRQKRKRIMSQDHVTSNFNKSLRLARTIFIIYTIFSLCWIPFAILLVADVHDTFAHELHLLITVLAHLHPSVNWLIYYITNKNFQIGFKRLFKCKTIVDQDKHSVGRSSHALSVRPFTTGEASK